MIDSIYGLKGHETCTQNQQERAFMQEWWAGKSESAALVALGRVYVSARIRPWMGP